MSTPFPGIPDESILTECQQSKRIVKKGYLPPTATAILVEA